MTKYTKKNVFAALMNNATELAVTTNKGEKITLTAEELKEFFAKEITTLDKKNTNKKESAENASIKENVTTLLADGEPRTVTQVIDYIRDTTGASYSTPKITAIMRIMIAEGTVERIEDKKKAYFKAV